MTVIKIALSVLGTIGLTAGTMLAVAEPTPEPLATLPPSACASTSCSKGKCQTSAACAVSTCAASACSSKNNVCADPNTACAANACTVETPAPLQASEPVAAIANKACASKCRESSCADGACKVAKEGACKVAKECEDACTAKVAAESVCPEKCGRLMVGTGVNSNSGVVGNIVRTSATECETSERCSNDNSGSCTKEKCSEAVTAKQPVEAKSSRRLSIRLGLSNKGPIVQVSTGDRKSDQCESCPNAKPTGEACGWTAIPVAIVKACVSGACGTAASESCSKGSSCGSTEAVMATACEAKAACATPKCATASVAAHCECDGCCQEGCKAGDACCDKCESPGCEGTQCLPVIQASKSPKGEWFRRSPGQREGNDFDFEIRNVPEAAEMQVRAGHAGCENNPPGVVHLSHSPMHPYHLRDDIQYFAPGPDSGSPSRHWLYGMDSFPSMAAGAAFENLVTWPQLRMVSFVAPEPPEHASKAPEHHHSIEGDWSRTVGSASLNLTIEEGRLRGTWHDGGDEPSVRFSGTCSVSGDGQIFGLIDDVSFGVNSGVPPHFYNWIIDQPFAIRFRMDGEEIVLKDFRCAGMPTIVELNGHKVPLSEYVQAFVSGRFSRSE